MNIFVLDENPIRAAEMMCDKHIPKMVVESAQMMASAVRRWGATDDVMPLTKAGKPYKGGYANHPCTLWAGDTFGNFGWLADHAIALCDEYTYRFGKVHACDDPITTLWRVGIDWVGEDGKFYSTKDQFRQALVFGSTKWHGKWPLFDFKGEPFNSVAGWC